MKKSKILLSAALLVFLIVSSAYAGNCPPPKLDGNDVMVPAECVEKIPGFNPNKQVYAACDENGWFVIDSKVTDYSKERTKMQPTPDKNYYIAFGMYCERFHPIQIDYNGKPKWAKIEMCYNLDSYFIDTSGPGPCLEVCQ